MYARPADFPEALKLLAEPDARILAGGTDIFPAADERPLGGRFVDVTSLSDLRGIGVEDDWIRIGAAVTWSDFAKADLPHGFDALKVGSARNRRRANPEPRHDCRQSLQRFARRRRRSAAADSRRRGRTCFDARPAAPAARRIHCRQSPHSARPGRNHDGDPRAAAATDGALELSEARGAALSRDFDRHGRRSARYRRRTWCVARASRRARARQPPSGCPRSSGGSIGAPARVGLSDVCWEAKISPRSRQSTICGPAPTTAATRR